MRSLSWILITWVGLFISCDSEHGVMLEPTVEHLNIETGSSLAPNLFRSPSGLLYLSWIEMLDDSTYSLKYATHRNDVWSDPSVIVSGGNWFVNWADIPAIVTDDDKHIGAHWLQMSGDGTYDYSIHITLSKDGGQTWSEPIIPHQQEVAAEHGFVSMAPIDDTHFQIVWLDGRNTKVAEDESNGHGHGGGQMTLRSATMDYDGNISADQEIDNRVCDCCQTDMIIDNETPIVIYRDRSHSEVRDISISRYYNNQWTEPIKVHNDEWIIHGCPVNGPALASHNEHIGVAWYTASSETPKVLMAISEDGGKNFGAPYRLDNGEPSGRVDLIPWKEGFMASWVESRDAESYLMMSYIVDGIATEAMEIMPLNASRSGGFPIIEPVEDGIVIALTQVNKSETQVATKKVLF